MIAPPCLMPERNPVAFVAVGSVPIHAPDPVNELAETQIVRALAGRRSKSNGGERYPDYFTARRILDRGKEGRMPEPLRLPPPLSRLPWDIAQSEFGGQGTDFIGVLSALLQRDAQSQFRAYLTDLPRLPDTLPPASAQSQFAPVQESLQQGTVENEARVSPTGSPL